MELGSIGPEYVSFCRIPFGTAAFSPFQIIKKSTNQKAVQNLSSLDSIQQLFEFLVPSVGFLALALAGCLIYWVVSRLFVHFKKSSILTFRRNLQTKIFLLFFVVFLFHIKQFYEISLNTSSVLVRTDDLLYSKKHILRTKKEFCFLEKGSEVDFLRNVRLTQDKNEIGDQLWSADSCRLTVADAQYLSLSSSKSLQLTHGFFSRFRLQKNRCFTSYTRRETQRTPAF